MFVGRGEQHLRGRAAKVSEFDDIESERLVDPTNVILDIDARRPAKSVAPQPPRRLESYRPRIGDGDPG